MWISGVSAATCRHCITIGQNDYWGNYSQSGAQDNYINFAQTLRGEYPDAHIILALGSMNATQSGSPWPGYLQYAVSELNSTYNDPKVYSLIFPYSGNPHPTIARHADMADQLTEFLQSNIPGFGVLIVDFNNDGIVDINDLVILIEYWYTDESLCDIAPPPDGDGIVDKKDLEVFMSYWDQVIDVAAYWKLDEAEGLIAYDSSGNYHDANVIGDPNWQPEGGMVDGALEFDGINDYVATPYVINPGIGQFSVFAWIKGGDPGQVILSQVGGANWLSANISDGALMTELKGGGRTGSILVSQTVITDGDWHRVGLVWDGINRMLYVDDEAVSQDTQANLSSSEGDLLIGTGNNMDTGTFWTGLIDEVRIYNRAITP
jgi:hypothetical protein